MKPSQKLSVIVPVFNPCELLYETIDSILEQTFTTYELILIDDGSTDSYSCEIISAICNRNKEIRLIRHAGNKGLSAARNTGVNNARGEYIFFIDGDDLIEPTTLEKFSLTLDLHPEFDFVNSFVTGFGDMDYKWTGGFHDTVAFLKENRNTSCFMARRNVFDVLAFDENMKAGCEDWDFWLAAAASGHWGTTIPEFLFKYRRRNRGNWETLNSTEHLLAVKQQLLKKHADEIEKRGFPVKAKNPYSFDLSATKVKSGLISNNAKNILFIFPWLEVGGADKFNLDLLNGLKEKGWKFTIVCTLQGENKWQGEFESITKDIHYLYNYCQEWDYYKALENIITIRNPSIIFVSNSMYGYYALPWLKRTFPHIKIADYIHCEDPGWYGGGYPMFSSLFQQSIDKTFTTSEQLKQWCVNKGANASKIHVRYINIDTAQFKRNIAFREEIRNSHGIRPDNIVILFVARLTDQKQPLVLIDSISELYKRNKNFKLVIIGDGPDKERLVTAIRSSPAKDNVLYLGSQPNTTVQHWMDAADIFFLPSAYEGIALSIFEAMAKNLAIVGADVGGQNELVTPTCGFLIQPRKGTRLSLLYADALESLLTNKQLLAQMGNEGRKRVQSYFRLDQMLADMDQELSKLICETNSNNNPDGQEIAVLLNRLMFTENELRNALNRPVTVLDKISVNYNQPRVLIKKIIKKAVSFVRQDEK